MSEAKETKKLPPLSSEITYALAMKTSSVIKLACEANEGIQANPKTKAMMVKRVPPSMIPKFELMDNYHELLVDEIVMILDRILAYPATTRYRNYLQGKPDDILKAWQIHSQSLRVGELYIILDRTKALLKFLNQVAENCGVIANSQHNAFERQFKKTFKKRLLERHRLVHAHERPSLESRIISVSSETIPFPKEEAANLLLGLSSKLIKILDGMGVISNDNPMESFQEIKRIHEEASDREAMEMLDIVGEAMLATVCLVPEPSKGTES